MSRRSSASSGSLDLTSLPFPQPLARSAFTGPTFSATDFLASLQNRHQSLEDLRTELRTRSSELEHELLALINADYAAFVGLGGSLTGGDGRVKDLMAGVMAVEREVNGMRNNVLDMLNNINEVMRERKKVADGIKLARTLIALDNHLTTMESMLLIETASTTKQNSLMVEPAPISSILLDNDNEVDDGDDGGESNSLTSARRLQHIVSSYGYLQYLLARLPETHTFVKAQNDRVGKIKRTMMEDLTNALKDSCGSSGEKDDRSKVGKLLAIMKLWAEIGEERTAVKVLREIKTKR